MESNEATAHETLPLYTEGNLKMARLLGDLHRTYFTKAPSAIERLLIPTLQDQLMQHILSAPEELLASC